MARRSCSTSSSRPASASGCACPASSACCRTAMKARAPRRLLRAARAFPADVRRRQYAGCQLHDAGELLPHPAPPAQARLSQAADSDDAEVAAAPQARGVAAQRNGTGNFVPPAALGRRAAVAERENQAGCRREDPPHRYLFRAKSITISTTNARSAASTTFIFCASSSFTRSRPRR